MYYPRSENKGADQLRGYRQADLRLCLRLCGACENQQFRFPTRSETNQLVQSEKQAKKPEILDLERRGIVLSMKRKQRR